MKVKKHPHAGQTGIKADFLKAVNDLARRGRRHSEVLDDFLELAFCAVARGVYQHLSAERAEAFEQRYMKRVGQRDPEYVREIAPLFAMMQAAVAEGRCDFLGEVAGELGALHEGLGQFFTPYHLSAVMAAMQIDDGIEALIAERGYFTVDEPASGAGGMLLAVADVIQARGHNPTLCMRARATDLSETAFKMAYLQLSFRGIAAEVIHGDTLRLETFDGLVTPGMLLFHEHHRSRRFLARLRSAVDLLAGEKDTQPPAPATDAEKQPGGELQRPLSPSADQRGQLDLFSEAS